MPSRISTVRICCAGPPTSSSRRRLIRRCVVTPGFDVLGPEQVRCRDGVVRLHTSDRGERGDGVHPCSTSSIKSPSRYLRQTQSIDVRPGGDGRGRPFAAAVSPSVPARCRCLVHGSPPNPSNDRRIGFAIRYIPTDVAQLAGEGNETLVRDEDRHHHFLSRSRAATWNSWHFSAPSPSATPILFQHGYPHPLWRPGLMLAMNAMW